MNRLNTFWNILRYARIEIPTIQRDYTYGRPDAQAIMRKIVGDIVDALLADSPLHLDFVYGKLVGKGNEILARRNRETLSELLRSIKEYASGYHLDISYKVEVNSADNASLVTFVPLDGQQRLTTLYLIHVYLAQRLADPKSLNQLQRFSYATRTSSREFCKMICEEQMDFDSYAPSEALRNSEHYFSFWTKDPTVRSMLVVLDEIHNWFSEHDASSLHAAWERLVVGGKIHFDFLDLEDFELTDELYIKMNARGRQLSSFENFKAWLVKTFEDSGAIEIENWQTKMDVAWTDLIWSHKPKGDENIDGAYLQFFKDQFLPDYIKSKLSKNSTAEHGSIEGDVNSLRSYTNNPTTLLQSELFKKQLPSYLELLDRIDHERMDEKPELLTNYWTHGIAKLLFRYDGAEFSWWHHTMQYAVSQYIRLVNGPRQQFLQWLRVISNLIFNSAIDDPNQYRGAIGSIDDLISKISPSTNIYQLFSQLDEKVIRFFPRGQKQEEILKADLIVQNPDWEGILMKAEQHNYFYGQIEFLLELSWTGSPGGYSISSFQETFRKVGALFSAEALDAKNNLIVRAFLSFGDCFHKDGDRWTFNGPQRNTVRQRNENWRRMFSNPALREYILKVVSHEKFDEADVVGSLQQIIDAEKEFLPAYLKKLVENPSLLEYARQRCIRIYDHGYYLLRSSRISGYFVELNTYDWYTRKEDRLSTLYPNAKVQYWEMRGEDSDPYIKVQVGRSKHAIMFDSKKGKLYLDEEPVQSIDSAMKMLTNQKARV